jgi:hypothetical protein
VSPSGPNPWPHMALMHSMGMQQYYGGKNHEASDPDLWFRMNLYCL